MVRIHGDIMIKPKIAARLTKILIYSNGCKTDQFFNKIIFSVFSKMKMRFLYLMTINLQ